MQLNMQTQRKIFSKLNRGEKNLFDAYNINELRSKLIIKFDDKNGFYKFTVFDSPWELYQHINSLPKKQRHFFEVVTNLTCRKPHFDVDFIVDSPAEVSSIDILTELVIACDKVMKVYKKTLDYEEDVIILSSHGWKDKKYKVSYHVIIDNYYLQTDKHAKQFCQEVLGKMKDLHDLIDDKIYSSIRQFRLIGNSKYDSTRYLEQLNTWTCAGKEIHSIPRGVYQTFFASLIGVTGHCKKIPIKLPLKEHTYSEVDIRADEVQDAFEKLKDFLSSQNISAPFTIRDVQNGLIMLNREEPSECPICKVVHEAENPYLILTENKDVLFNCRRSEVHLNIGDVKCFDYEIEEENDVYFIEQGKIVPNLNDTRKERFKRSQPIKTKKVMETVKGYLSSSEENSSYED